MNTQQQNADSKKVSKILKNQETDRYGRDERPEIEELKKEGNDNNWNWKKNWNREKNNWNGTSGDKDNWIGFAVIRSKVKTTAGGGIESSVSDSDHLIYNFGKCGPISRFLIVILHSTRFEMNGERRQNHVGRLP